MTAPAIQGRGGIRGASQTARAASSWTEDRIERMRIMRANGDSASQIAKALGGVTRSAVIGKCVRMRLPASHARPASAPGVHVVRHARPPRPKPTPRSEPTRIRVASNGARTYALPAAKALPTPRPILSVVVSAPVPLMQLGPRHCRWPLGDPGSADFAFCGAPKVGDGAYCAGHAALAYVERQASAASLAKNLRRYLG